jgi:hypothetical protein
MTEMQTKAGRRGMRDMRTAVTARIRSKPTTEGQRYLDLYVLQRDRFRWRRLKHQAEKAIDSIDKALAKLGFSPDYGESDQSTFSEHRAVGTGAAAAKRPGVAARRRRSA